MWFWIRVNIIINNELEALFISFNSDLFTLNSFLLAWETPKAELMAQILFYISKQPILFLFITQRPKGNSLSLIKKPGWGFHLTHERCRSESRPLKSLAAQDVWLQRTIKNVFRPGVSCVPRPGGSAHTGSVPTAATFSPSLKVSTPHDPGNWFEAVVQIWINCANIYKEWSKLASQEAETHISNQLLGFSLVRSTLQAWLSALRQLQQDTSRALEARFC